MASNIHEHDRGVSKNLDDEARSNEHDELDTTLTALDLAKLAIETNDDIDEHPNVNDSNVGDEVHEETCDFAVPRSNSMPESDALKAKHSAHEGLTLPKNSHEWHKHANIYFKDIPSWELFDVELIHMTESSPFEFKYLLDKAAFICGLPPLPNFDIPSLSEVRTFNSLQEAFWDRWDDRPKDDSNSLKFGIGILSCILEEEKKKCDKERKSRLKTAEMMRIAAALRSAEMMRIAAALRRIVKKIMKINRLVPRGYGEARVSRDEGRSDPLENEYQDLVQKLMHMLFPEVKKSVNDAVFYPQRKGYAKSPVICIPDLEVISSVETKHADGEEVDIDYILMVLEIKREYKESQRDDCLKHCERTIHQHFSQLLASIKGSMFAQDFTKRHHARTEHPKICHIFGMMFHQTKVQFTCLRLEKDHMSNIVRRSIRRGVDFNSEHSLTSDETNVPHVNIIGCNGNEKGCLYISSPYDMQNFRDLFLVMNCIHNFKYYSLLAGTEGSVLEFQEYM